MSNNIITTYIRSSSYNTWDSCQHKYYLDYGLGFRSPANLAAQKGTIVHKALELLAQFNLTKKAGKVHFTNSELAQTFTITTFSPEMAIELAYKFYVDKHEYEYTDKDFEDCQRWMWEALTYKEGMFSPLQLNIVAEERFFDLEIKKPWAAYNYTLHNERIKGYLHLKGTLDLIVKRDNNVLEVIDWKTGSRRDWVTGKTKNYDEFVQDPQIRLYHYAATILYQWASQILFTIFWLKDGGPFTICFHKDDMKQTEQMLRQRFEEITSCIQPKLIYPNYRCRLCYYSNHDLKGNVVDYEDSSCKKIADKVIELGLQKVNNKYGNKLAITEYGEGGGKTHDR